MLPAPGGAVREQKRQRQQEHADENQEADPCQRQIHRTALSRTMIEICN